MAGIWTRQGVDLVKQKIASGEPISFNVAKVNVTTDNSLSIALHEGLTELPNPQGSFTPVYQYDDTTKILTCSFEIPPAYGLPEGQYINGVGYYIDDTLVYVEQIVPRRITSASLMRIASKINLGIFNSSVNVMLHAFSYNAGVKESFALDPGASWTKTFASEIKEAKVYEQDASGNWIPSSYASISFSSDFKTISVTNNATEALNFTTFLLVDTNPIIDNITVDDIQEIKDTVYIGSQPPAPTDGYKLFYSPDTNDLYFANTTINRWADILGSTKTRILNFWEKALTMSALDLSGRVGLYEYIINDCRSFDGFSEADSPNVSLYDDSLILEVFKGTASLITNDITIDGITEATDLSIAVDFVSNKPDLIKVYYDTGAGWTELAPKTGVTLSSVNSFKLKFEAVYDASIVICPALYGIIIVSDKKLIWG